MKLKPFQIIAVGLLGIVFGITMVKSEVISWYRIQEMFRFQAFHMYGVILSGVLVAMISQIILKKLNVRDANGEPLHVDPKETDRGFNVSIGGVLFGLGWALTGACPGPLYALIGSGYSVMLVTMASALFGAWVYGHLRPRLPH